MELLIILLILGVLLWIFGVPLQMLLLGAVILAAALLGLMLLFFISTAFSLIAFRVKKGSFVRFNQYHKFERAVYLVEETEYVNLFPAETVMRERLYHESPHTLLIRKGRHRSYAYDMHSVLIIVLGLFASAAMFGMFAAVLSLFWG